MERILITQLALRYLRGKRTANVVPVLSRISMVAIAVCAAAMIVVFSVFNGLEGIVKDLYKGFYPDVRISLVKGKFFPATTDMLNKVKQLPGVEHMTLVLEDNVLANTSFGEQKPVTLKGINNDYFYVNDVGEYITDGEDSVSMGHPYTAIGGQTILNELGADVTNIFSNIELFYLNPAVTNPEGDPTSAFQSLTIHPAGKFDVGDEFNSKYILAPLPLVQDLFKAGSQYSSIEIKAKAGKIDDIKEGAAKLLGSAFKVESRYEQNRTMYAVMKMEKWAIYAILVLVLVIASFNMVGALSMLVLQKKKDIAILRAMGAMPSAITKIFIAEGVLWALVGGVAGILLGSILCMLQQQFGFVKLAGNEFFVDAYPVEIQLTDLLLVLVTVFAIGLLAAWYPARRATAVMELSLKSS